MTANVTMDATDVAARTTTDGRRHGAPPRDDPSPAPRRRAGAEAPLVVVANRLPIQRVAEGAAWCASPGGLASALTSVLRRTGGSWVGWSGESDDQDVPAGHDGIDLRSVPMSARDYEEFYLGFSNATIWPLYHDAVRQPAFHREWWRAYEVVNQRFAEAAAAAVSPGGSVWVHDYQLQLVPRLLRELRPDVRIGFFLHVPFPPRELFMQLPWRRELLAGLLGADLVGFQLPGAATNFSRLARRLMGAEGKADALRWEGRTVQVGAFPISVDVPDLEARASSAAIRQRSSQLRHELGDPDLVLLGVDRLDYTKGIEQRVRALAELYEEGTLVAARAVVVQIAVPTREADPHYQDERRHLEQIVGEVNGEHAVVGAPVIHYLHQSLDIDELVAMYLAADVLLVTPFRDGMNLVAKEYVAIRTDDGGRLVLSEFAGAAAELRGAFLVNPHDLEGMKEAIRAAIDASPAAARARMRRMRRGVARRDVHAWAGDFLAALARDVGASDRR